MTPETVFRRRWAILAVLCVSLLIVGLDNTILNVALPTLVRDLHASASQLQWIVDAYTIVFAGLVITAGSLGDRFGRRAALLAGLAIFGTGSGLSAFSHSADELILFRCLMGIGGAFIMPSTLSVLTNVFTRPGERARAIGLWSGTSGLGIAIGPILGGWLLDHFWWGSVFLVNVPVVGVGLLAVLALVPDSRDPAARRPDPVGTVLSIAGLGSLLYGIIEAPVDGWGNPGVVAGLAAGIAILAAFVLWELRIDHPMFQMHFFRRARFSAASVSVTFVFFALFGALFLLTQYLQSVLGFSPLGAGLRIAPVAVVLAIGAPLSSGLVRRVGTKLVVTAGMLLIVGGLGLLATLAVDSSYTTVLVGLLVLGFGMGITMAPATESIMGALPREQAGVGSAMNSTNIQVGGAVGVAVLGSVLDSHYRHQLAHLVGSALPASALHAAQSSLGAALVLAHRLPTSQAEVFADLARRSFTKGVDIADVVAAGIALAGALVALLFLPSRAPAPGPLGPTGPGISGPPSEGAGLPVAAGEATGPGGKGQPAATPESAPVA